MTSEIFHNMVVSASAELVGMWLLILLGNGVVATCVLNKTKGTNAGWLTICFGWLIALFLAITVSTAINNNSLHPGWTSSKNSSEAMLGITVNPVGLIIGCLRNIYNETQIINSSIYLAIAIIAQCTGAFIGQLGIYIIYKKHYNETIDQKAILATHSTIPSIRSYGTNFMTEVIATFVLFFAISTISTSYPNQVGILASIVVFGIGISMGSATGFALNPTRDLIPRLFHQTMPYKNKGNSDWKYGWIPVLGPLTGGMVALIASPGMLW